LVSALEKCTEIKPIVFGKPCELGIEHILEEHHLVKEKTLIIGDKLGCDILAAKKAGLKSCLTLGGFTERVEVDKQYELDDPILPSYLIDKVCV